jgi:hypothetical protein
MLKKLLFIIFFISNYFSFAQKSQELQIPVKIVTYSNDNCYSRSIIKVRNNIITGNSNGKIISYNLNKKSTKNLSGDLQLGEIRDLEYIDGNIYGLQSADSGLLVKTSLKGESTIIENSDWSNVFLDGLAIENNLGFIMGDPVNGIFSLFISFTAGLDWEKCEGQIESFQGEAGFAASGTTVQIVDNVLFFVSGGANSRFFKSLDFGKTWISSKISYPSGSSIGPFSIYMSNTSNGIVVGGDYLNPNDNKSISFTSDDGGHSWIESIIQPRGYRSCIIFANNVHYACGSNGIDYSIDNGKTWLPFADGNYFCMTTSKKHLFATTTKGTFHVFNLIKNK